MQVTVSATNTDDIYTLEIQDDMELKNFKALCAVESNIPAHELTLFWNGQILDDNKKQMKDYGIKTGDVLLLFVELNLAHQAMRSTRQD